jgi:hypothetical protein
MTTTTVVPPKPTVLPPGLTKKQRKYVAKYDTPKNRNAGLITARIHESWYTPVPPQLRSKGHVLLGATVVTIIVGAIVAAIIGTPDASALYYGTTQTNHGVKGAWDTVWTPLRHAYRDCMTGLFGGLAAVFVTRDLYKPLKPLTPLDQREIAFSLPLPFTSKRWHPLGNVKDDQELSAGQVLALPVTVILGALFGFFVGEFLLFAVHWAYTNVTWYHNWVKSTFGSSTSFLNAHLSEHNAALATRIHNSLVASLPLKLVGLLAAFFFGRRFAKPCMDDLKRELVRRRLVKNFHAGQPNKRAPWYYLRNFRMIYYTEQPNVTTADKIPLHTTIGLGVLLFTMLGLAGAGWYILLYVANK